MSLYARLRSRAIHSRTPERRAYWTRALLRHKARRGTWDARMLNGHPGNVTAAVKRYIMRGVAAGLIVTSTTDGGHAATSYHYTEPLGRAADLGHRKPGTPSALKALVRFQRREARHPGRYLELYGPDNSACVRGRCRATLAEGSPLEVHHDNHVHGAPIR